MSSWLRLSLPPGTFVLGLWRFTSPWLLAQPECYSAVIAEIDAKFRDADYARRVQMNIWLRKQLGER